MDYRNHEHYYDPTPAAAMQRINKQKDKVKIRVRDKIFAIDPGTTMSGYVILQHNGKEITHVLDKGKIANEEIMRKIHNEIGRCEIVLEMVGCYSMAVGKSVFDTCVWIGRFLEAAEISPSSTSRHLIYRYEEKSCICHTVKANDTLIRMALIDRFAYGVPNKGKGTKKEPGFFYGFAADAWQAMAVAVTWFDKQRGACR